MNASDCKYFDVIVTKIIATTVNGYFKVTESDFHIFIESGDTDNNTEKEIIGMYKMKRFNSYFCYF